MGGGTTVIVSASRRTDLPAHYAKWLGERAKAGYLLVRHPRRYHQVYRLDLQRGVDGWVFWSKDPAPLYPLLPAFDHWPYYFQFTLTGYGADIEPGLRPKKALAATFLQLAARLGKRRVIWRYDPILLGPQYTAAWHRQQFAQLAEVLQGATERCVISFLDDYKNAPALYARGLRPPTADEARQLMAQLAPIARRRGMTVCTCAEELDLAAYGVAHGRCIDGELLAAIGGTALKVPRDTGQRPACGCGKSVDIGLYNSCPSGCRYCYANFSPGKIAGTVARYDPYSPLLGSELGPDDVVRPYPMTSFADLQMTLY